MKNWFAQWKKRPLYAKVLSAIVALCSAVIVVLAVMFLLDFYTGSILVVMPVMGVAMLAQAALYWKRDRALAGFTAILAAFLIVLYFIRAKG